MRVFFIAVGALCVGLIAGFFVGREFPSNQSPAPAEQARSARPLVLTPEAVQQVFRFRDQHKLAVPFRLRVEVTELPGGKGKHAIDLDTAPTLPEDMEFEFEGVRVVIARSQIEKLRGSTVGYRVLPDREGFYVINPNLPDSRE
jgi:Fe-S cluster assembly iron-binding protein IscA